MSKKIMTDAVKENLNGIAETTANHLRSEHSNMHRGAWMLSGGIAVVFGNDSYSTDPRSKAEAQAVMEAARVGHHLTSDIQTDEEGITWAIALHCKKAEADKLAELAWKTWFAESFKKGKDNQHN